MLSRRALPQLRSALNSVARLASSSATPATKPTESGVVTRSDKPATLQQSPNYATTWSTNQAPRPGPGTGPRFEQTNMNLQPNPLSAMEMVAREPIRLVKGRTAVCDGGAYISYHKQGAFSIGFLTVRDWCLSRRRTTGPPQGLHQLGA
jgi:NADH dehydrogenase (ubiquinone) Fe-S protein 6